MCVSAYIFLHALKHPLTHKHTLTLTHVRVCVFVSVCVHAFVLGFVCACVYAYLRVACRKIPRSNGSDHRRIEDHGHNLDNHHPSLSFSLP